MSTTFSVDVKSLNTNLTFMKRVSGATARASVPVLHAVRIDVTDGVATLGWFDYDTAATVRMPAGGTGSVVLRIADLVNGIKSLGGKGTATFEITDGGVTVTGADDTVIGIPLPSWESGDVPDMPADTADAVLITTGADMAASALVAGCAVGTDDTLPMLTGIRLELNADGAELASTDRFRLAVTNVPSSMLSDGETPPVLMSGRAFTVFAKRAAKHECVSIALTGDRVVLECDDATVSFRKLDAQFPKYRQLFPDEYDATVKFTLDPTAVVARLKAIAGTSPNVRLDVTTGGITAHGYGHHGAGEATFPFAAGELLTDGDLSVAFNTAYLASILATVPKGQKVRVAITTPSRPAVFTWDGVRTLLMPVRLPG